MRARHECKKNHTPMTSEELRASPSMQQQRHPLRSIGSIFTGGKVNRAMQISAAMMVSLLMTAAHAQESAAPSIEELERQLEAKKAAKQPVRPGSGAPRTPASGAARDDGASDDFLSPQAAFKYSLRLDGSVLKIIWDIAPGYYLYKQKLDASVNASGVWLGVPYWPASQTHRDEFFGEQQVYRGRVEIGMPLAADASASRKKVPVQLRLQGCADGGLCYSPMVWETSITLP
jgi:hypothetical protein